MKCPSCNQKLKKVAERLYACQICGVFYPYIDGKLGYPMAKPPRSLLEEKTEKTPMAPIDTWTAFLKKWGLTNQTYMKLPKELKNFYRYHYKQYLRQLAAEEEKRQREQQLINIIRPRTALGIKKI